MPRRGGGSSLSKTKTVNKCFAYWLLPLSVEAWLSLKSSQFKLPDSTGKDQLSSGIVTPGLLSLHEMLTVTAAIPQTPKMNDYYTVLSFPNSPNNPDSITTTLQTKPQGKLKNSHFYTWADTWIQLPRPQRMLVFHYATLSHHQQTRAPTTHLIWTLSFHLFFNGLLLC